MVRVSARDTSVRRDERAVETFGQRQIQRVVEGEAIAKLPGPRRYLAMMRVALMDHSLGRQLL